MIDPVQFGQFLRKCRKEKGLSQKRVGKALGILANNIANWEAGRMAAPIGRLPDLDRLFGLPIGTLELLMGVVPRHLQQSVAKHPRKALALLEGLGVAHV